MQFFVALSLLVALSGTYLLHQFWTRSLGPTDELSVMPRPSVPTEPEQAQGGISQRSSQSPIVRIRHPEIEQAPVLVRELP